MPGLCAYSGAFGAPGAGAHSLRVGGLAAVDLLATAGLAWAGTRLAGRTGAVAFALVFLLLLIAGVIAHEAFCVDTRLNAAIFGREWRGRRQLQA